jgi:hypothetical protein
MNTETKADDAIDVDPLTPIWAWLKKRFLEIVMVVGLFLCLPDWTREVGFLGIGLAVSCSILIGARTIAQALRDTRK